MKASGGYIHQKTKYGNLYSYHFLSACFSDFNHNRKFNFSLAWQIKVLKRWFGFAAPQATKELSPV